MNTRPLNIIDISILILATLCAAAFLLVQPVFAETVSAKQNDSTLHTQANGGTITYRAKVPLTPEFAYVIRKNSTVDDLRIEPKVGDVVQMHVHVLGAQSVPLSNHRVQMKIINAKSDETITQKETETNTQGLGTFSLEITEEMQKDLVANFFDITYHEIIALNASVRLEVQKTASPHSNDSEQGSKTLWILEMTTGDGTRISQAPVCRVEKIADRTHEHRTTLNDFSRHSQDVPRIAARDGPCPSSSESFRGNGNERTD